MTCLTSIHGLVVSGLLLAAPTPAADSARLAEAVAAYRSFDHARAIELVEPLAYDGNAVAQRMLGFMYSNGQGVERDERIAERWYCLSVRRGFIDSPGCPWFVYLTRAAPDVVGMGLQFSDAERFRAYLREAHAGDAPAQVALGLFYASGVGVKRDLVQAAMWLILAAEQHDPRAGALLENLELELTPAQIAEARRLAREWQPPTLD